MLGWQSCDDHVFNAIAQHAARRVERQRRKAKRSYFQRNAERVGGEREEDDKEERIGVQEGRLDVVDRSRVGVGP